MAKRENGKITARVARASSAIIASLDALVTLARTVTVESFADAFTRATANHGITHGTRNVARFTGWRIMHAQNVTLMQNATWKLDDVQLLFVWRALFPMATGTVFIANESRTSRESIARGVSIVRGVRADYNRGTHGQNGIAPKTPSESYGPVGRIAPVPANPVIVEPAKTGNAKRTRKSA